MTTSRIASRRRNEHQISDIQVNTEMFVNDSVHQSKEKTAPEESHKPSENVDQLETTILAIHYPAEKDVHKKSTDSVSENIEQVDAGQVDRSSGSLNEPTNSDTSHSELGCEHTAYNNLSNIGLDLPDIHKFEREYPVMAGAIKPKIEADPFGWFCDMVCSDLKFEMKCKQAKYGVFVSDQLLDCLFAVVFDQHSDLEIETCTVTRADGLGFRGKHISGDLLSMGKRQRNLGHLEAKDRAYLRSYVSSGRWRRFEPYIPQVIALVAAEICSQRIPGRWKWLKGDTPPEPYTTWQEWYQDFLAEELGQDDECVEEDYIAEARAEEQP